MDKNNELIWQMRGIISDARSREQTLVSVSVTDLDDLIEACATAAPQDAMDAEQSPKDRIDALFKSRLTPYGMLVRALRIVANTSLYEMAQAHGVNPSDLSAMEFGRKPVTVDTVKLAARFFVDCGIQGTKFALMVAMFASQKDRALSATPAAGER